MSTTPAAALAMLGTVTGELARVTRAVGREVRADAAELIAGRAALTGFSRGGQVSAGGSSFLLRAADGWCAASDAAAEDGDCDALAVVCGGCAGRDADEEAHPANRTAAMAASSGQGFAIGVPHRFAAGDAEVLASSLVTNPAAGMAAAPLDHGDVIAAAGDTGGRPEPELYFEIRRSGRPVDPLPWFRERQPQPAQ